MKPIPDLLNPIELAEKRIFDQAAVIYRSIDRLQYLLDQFETHEGMGPVKAIQRKRAETSLEEIKKQLEQGGLYQQHYINALTQNVAINKHSGDLAKMGYVYIVGMEGLREHVLRSFCFNKETNCYDRRLGEKNWKWMIEGLIVPELKSYGK